MAAPSRGGESLKLALALLMLGAAAAFATGLLLRPDAAPRLSLLRAAPPPAPTGPAATANRLVYRADRAGHFVIDAEVDGAPIRFLLDTGATLVALTPEDARAAGVDPQALSYSLTMSTANGTARAAPVRLRSLRLGQLEVEDVRAVVMERPMTVSLLGMSFLDRLSGYSIRDGILTVEW